MRRPIIDRNLLAVASLASILPILAVVLLFPTPSIDLREHINWGVNFPLYTWKHPPLQSWLAGLVALTSARDAWAYVIAAQCLNLVGLYYIVRTAGEFISEDAVLPVGAAFCGMASFSLTVPDMALNADLVQTALWQGALYHALRGLRDDRWLDWLAVGAIAALAILTKYFSILFLVSLALAAVWQDRSLWGRPGPYAAAVLALALLSPHLAQLLGEADTLQYGVGRTLRPTAGIPDRLEWLGTFFGALGLYNAGSLIGLGDAAARGKLQLREGAWQDGRGVIMRTALILLGLTIALIVLVGFNFRVRFAVPMVPLSILLIACLARMAPDAAPRFTMIVLGLTLIVWGAAVLLALAFPEVYVREPAVPRLYLRDPAPEAAARIRSDWDRRYACGPAYIIGADGHAVGLYFGGGVIGLSDDDLQRAHWVDHARLRDLGAVVVGPPRRTRHGRTMPTVPGATEINRLSLQYRRWPYGPDRVYLYYFLPPRQCAPPMDATKR